MPSTAMVALKPEEDAQQLVDLATSVLDPGATIHLLSLVKVGPGDEPGRMAVEKERLATVAKPLADAGYDAQVHVEVFAAAAGAEIAHVASTHGADLIVIGLGKRSRVGKALLGSDAQRLLLRAHCPVLCTRTT